MPDVDNRLAFILSETSRNQEYHNHKETMAWAATALYVTGAFTGGWELRALDKLLWKYLTLRLAILLTTLVVCFICWQLNKRKLAATRVKDLILASKAHIDNSPYKSQPVDFALTHYFQCVEEHKDDPNVTLVISLVAVGIAFLAFAAMVLL